MALGVFGVAVLGVGFLIGLKGLFSRRPQLIADAGGVTDRLGRFLRWSEVESIVIMPMRPSWLFLLNRMGFRLLVFRARPGIRLRHPWWWGPTRSLYGESLRVLEAAIPGTLEDLAGRIEPLYGGPVDVLPGTARR